MNDLSSLIERLEEASSATDPTFRLALNDPDWCMTCGGGGYVAADGEDERPFREGIIALLRSLQSSHPATASGIVERESGDAQ